MPSLFYLEGYRTKVFVMIEKILIRYKTPDNLDTKYHVNYEMRSNIAPLLSQISRHVERVANLFCCEAGAVPAVSQQLSPSLFSPGSDGEEEGNCYRR